ncbi:MAG: Flp pilus assembly complex ATPase component TadA [Fimbriimonadaceae bacterium]|nr:Flp pilus assembly complex ATPase component TadA [Fimbriimonadaceae bacterium]
MIGTEHELTGQGTNGDRGLPFVDLAELKPDPLAIDLVPGDYALKYQILPFALDGEILICAIASIDSLGALDDLGILIDRPVKPVLAEPGLIRNRIEERFLEDILSQIPTDDGGATEIDDSTDLADLQKMAGETAVVQMVNLFFAQAVRDGASDIHIEPYERDVKIRYRIDGLLRDMMRPPKRMHAALISRLKILGEMNIAERRLPQDGRIKLTIAGRAVDVRVSIVPTVYGERAVMRILDKTTALMGLDELGMFPDTQERFRKLIRIPYGIILVTGPTGSGKSTTLYASLQEIWSPTTNILTIEDPVEYQVPGIGQVQVRPGIGLTFASGLRSFLRQDPDIIMVGEIRDHETAEIAIHAALTGHLVFSTLHTNDAPGAITRLLDMGVEPFLAASSLVGVVAQRLLRRNCPNCSQPTEYDEDALRAIGVTNEEVKTANFMAGKGCDKCGGSGYKGRQGVYELLVLDEHIRHMTVERMSAGAIKQYGLEHCNLRTLIGDGKLNVLAGRTTPQEVLRVCQREDV